jgi:hypothetical protein
MGEYNGGDGEVCECISGFLIVLLWIKRRDVVAGTLRMSQGLGGIQVAVVIDPKRNSLVNVIQI